MTESQPRPLGAGPAVLPLLFYGVLALACWGPWVLVDPGSTLLAANDLDPSAYLWFFEWWPHALGEGLNPFFSDLIFVPGGYNLAWVTSMPGPSILLAPLTLAAGPVVTWNLVAFASPTLSAWTAFLLCRQVSDSFWPSLAGGLVFGFSPYMLYQLRGAPQLAFVALLPVLVLLAVRHAQGSLSDRRFGIAATAMLFAQILISTEVLATAVVFGALALAAAFLLYPEARAALRRTAALLAASLLATAVLASPLLYYVFFGERTLPEQALAQYPADLLSLVVPGVLIAAGEETLGGDAPVWATGASYFGLPLLVLIGAFGWIHRRRRAALLAVFAFLVAALAALGTALVVGGSDTGVPLPWRVFSELPLLRYAIPLRFSAFAFLAAAVAVAMWLAWRPNLARWALVALVGLSLAPAIGNSAWHTPVADVPFFAGETHERYLRPADRVLTIPAWGKNMYWQTQAGFSFGLAGGYAGAFPESYTRFAAWTDFLSSPFPRLDASAPAKLRRFVEAKSVNVVVVDQREPAAWRRLVGGLGAQPEDVGGVLVYRLGPAR